MTAEEIIDEISRLTPVEQARVVRLVKELNRPLSGEELWILAKKLVHEIDPSRAQALKDQIIAGFYGDEQYA